MRDSFTAEKTGKKIDLITGPLQGNKLKMHKIDPKTAQKTVLEIGGE